MILHDDDVSSTGSQSWWDFDSNSLIVNGTVPFLNKVRVFSFVAGDYDYDTYQYHIEEELESIVYEVCVTTTTLGDCSSTDTDDPDNQIGYVLPENQQTDYRYNLDQQDVAEAFEFGGFFEDYGGYANYRCEQ